MAAERSGGLEKAPDAFRTISEVADELDLPQHVLRFWETRFGQIRPLKRGGGRRYYRPEDIDLLRGIKHLLYGEGYTIKGVQRILKSQGQKFVQSVWRDPASLKLAEAARHARPVHETEEEFEEDEHAEEPPPAPFPAPAPAAAPMMRLVEAEAGVDADVRPLPRPLALRPLDDEAVSDPASLPLDAVRRLRATLADLIEAKQMLDRNR